MGFSIGGLSLGSSRTRSSSASESSSQSSSRTSQDVFLADLYSRLFSGAEEAAGGIDTGGITNAANSLYNQGAGFIDMLEGSATPGFVASPLQVGGFVGDPVSARGVAPISIPGSTVDAEIGQLETDLGRFFSEQINPAISDEAVSGYGLGGGRQGVAQGIAAEGLLGEYARGVTDIRARDIERQIAVQSQNQQAGIASSGLDLEAAKFSSGLEANMALAFSELGLDAGKFNQTMASSYDLASRELMMRAATEGIGALGGQLDLLEGGAFAGMSPYLMLAQILQDPTVLTQAESQSSGQSSSTSSSSGRSWDFGLMGA